MATPRKKRTPTPPTAESETPKAKIKSVLEAVPHHPIWAELNDEENKDRVWIIEYVREPRAFMARSIPEPVDMAAINREIAISVKALQTGSPLQDRYILFVPYSGNHARRITEFLVKDLGNPTLPFTGMQLFDLDAAFRGIQ